MVSGRAGRWIRGGNGTCFFFDLVFQYLDASSGGKSYPPHWVKWLMENLGWWTGVGGIEEYYLDPVEKNIPDDDAVKINSGQHRI